MNLATANTVGNTPAAFVTTRNTGIGVQGVGTQSLSQSQDEFSSFGQDASDTKTLSPYIARYPTVAFTYNEDASRLIMLFRDPSTGQKVSQIPSEVVVKQYEEVQTAKRRSERPSFQVVVGDATASKTDGVNGTDNSAAAAAGGALTGVVAAGSATDGAGSSTGGSMSGGYAGTTSGGAYSGSSSGGGFSTAGGSVGTGGSGSSGILGSGASGGGTASLNLVI
eukprot:RCo016874